MDSHGLLMRNGEIVAQMRDDELRHAAAAREAGAAPLPPPVQALMRAAAKVMTTVAQRV